MLSILRTLTVSFAALALVAIDTPTQAQGKGKEEQKEHGKGGQKEKKAKQHKHHNGKDLVADKIKKNGKHKFHEHGKHSAFVNVSNGKIAGVEVTHAEKGKVPVKKYKTSKKMADASAGGMQRASLVLAQARYLGSTWIGYAYIDDWGDEVIYWFEYDMVLDGDTGAIEYIPVA
jgi:hypothetical protein